MVKSEGIPDDTASANAPSRPVSTKDNTVDVTPFLLKTIAPLGVTCRESLLSATEPLGIVDQSTCDGSVTFAFLYFL